jgi:hypothetical protein
MEACAPRSMLLLQLGVFFKATEQFRVEGGGGIGEVVGEVNQRKA